ncbi:hypothetical protein KKF84_06760 [Myxococcota bacterium]|nr:hypothetical protein [Myxococcota bacterium]MBU1535002.1 hypothetical protein [Myxococcota bacterium]
MAVKKKKNSKQSGNIIVILVALILFAAIFASAMRGCGGKGSGEGDGSAKNVVPAASSMTPVTKLFMTVTVKKDAYYLENGATPLALEELVKNIKSSGKKVKINYNKASYATAVEKLEQRLKKEGVNPLMQLQK